MLEKTLATQRTLPDFDNPPAVETVMGVHFVPIPKWQSPYFGLFWARVKKDYPRIQMQPPIVQQPPDLIPMAAQGPWEIGRCWFFNQNETRLIQVQNNLFLHNWRKMAPTEKYLHYDELRPHFGREWEGFRRFLEEEGLETPKISQCEVTYVNHIDRGSGWETFADLSDVFPNWSPGTHKFLPPPQLVLLNVSYPLKEANGTLQITAQPAVRQSDVKETIQLTVTARTKPLSSSAEDIYGGLDEARKWVVLGFTDFTGPSMHKLWGRKL